MKDNLFPLPRVKLHSFEPPAVSRNTSPIEFRAERTGKCSSRSESGMENESGKLGEPPGRSNSVCIFPAKIADKVKVDWQEAGRLVSKVSEAGLRLLREMEGWLVESRE